MAAVQTESFQLVKFPGMNGKHLNDFLARVRESLNAKQLSCTFQDNRADVWKLIGQAVAQSTITTFNAKGCTWDCNTIKVFFDQQPTIHLHQINLNNNKIQSVGAMRILHILKSASQIIHIDVSNNPIPANQKKEIQKQAHTNLIQMAIVLGQLSRKFHLPNEIMALLFKAAGLECETQSPLYTRLGQAFFIKARNAPKHRVELLGSPSLSI